MCVNILDDQSLEIASDVIRDGQFADSEFRFDSPQRTATLTIWKADEELTSFERGGLFVLWRVSPMRRLELIFRSVVGVEFVRNSSAPGPHPIGGIRWNSRDMVYIETYDGLTISLAVNELDGALHITADIDPHRIQRSRTCSLFRGTTRGHH